ncbi:MULTISPECIES: TRAP transporter permease [Bhargavaea]|uniref:TRAP transporter permease n=1 Tax=Bhargavaea changchunensis TaxID=2134037 RepID=A0ABW2NA40_9BACL|nr:TRAP transporter permease [Bhargavaea sp. CC-171006]
METKNEKGLFPFSIMFIGIAWCLFQLYTAAFGVLPALQQRSIHLLFALVMIFLLFPFSVSNPINKDRFTVEKTLMVVLSLFATGYIAINHVEIWSLTGNLSIMQEIISFLIILLVLEATRRVVGWSLPIIAMIFIAYSYFGSYLPALFQHQGYTLSELFRHEVMGLEGIFGVALGVAATFVFLFILYAAILQVSGGGQIFIDLSTAVVGKIRGGPAKISVIASCLFGSISGSAVANTAGTGAFTIPLMKKTGYSKRFAASVEAVSSTGGQFMPPVMGSAAFLIAEVLSIPFWQVALGALIPGVLYYVAVFIMVDIEAVKNGIKGMEPKDIPSLRETFRKGWHLMLSPLTLVFLLLYLQWSPMKAAFWAIVITIISTFVNKNNRMTISQLFSSMKKGAVGSLETTIACACVGIVIGVINQTGLGFSISSILITLAGENLFLLLLLTMVVSLILGMGLPTVAAYLVLSVMVAPALVNLGVNPLAAHLFIFYFGIISAITPPVALASIVAAGIAEEKPLVTSLTSLKLGIPGFLLPFMFVLGPELILEGTAINIIISVITALFGIYSLAVAIQKYHIRPMRLWESLIFGISAVGLLYPGWLTDLVGISVIVFMSLYLWKTKNKVVSSINKSLAV